MCVCACVRVRVRVCLCNITLRRVHENIVVVEKQ